MYVCMYAVACCMYVCKLCIPDYSNPPLRLRGRGLIRKTLFVSFKQHTSTRTFIILVRVYTYNYNKINVVVL